MDGLRLQLSDSEPFGDGLGEEPIDALLNGRSVPRVPLAFQRIGFTRPDAEQFVTDPLPCRLQTDLGAPRDGGEPLPPADTIGHNKRLLPAREHLDPEPFDSSIPQNSSLRLRLRVPNDALRQHVCPRKVTTKSPFRQIIG